MSDDFMGRVLKRAREQQQPDTPPSMRGKAETIIADYVNGLRGEMSRESAAELFDELLTELESPSEGMIEAMRTAYPENVLHREGEWRAAIQHIKDGGY